MTIAATLPRSSMHQTLSVYFATQFCVTDGVAEGEPMSFADELVMDDVYVLTPSAHRRHLTVDLAPETQTFRVAAHSDVGTAQNIIHLDCCVTLMGNDGATTEALVLVEVEDNTVAGVYLLPLAGLAAGADYRLVGVDRHAATTRLAEASCVSFTRGTRITMANGEQRPIEQLSAGDRVLCRDDGPQEIRWVGQTTVRAVGALAPVKIAKGALYNANDLTLSPDHRLFVYQREDRLGTGQSEVLVKVRHLINGDSVVQQDGGFVDYFQLLFDDHQIIFAEGIAAESLLLDPRTRAAVPTHVSSRGRPHEARQGYEITENLLSQPDAIDVLRQATSSGHGFGAG